MTDPSPPSLDVLARELTRLADEVRRLGRRVEHLERRLGTDRASAPPEEAAGAVGRRAPEPQQARFTPGLAASLQRAATVCFVLVVALILRTATDAGWIPAGAGTWLGLAYALGVVVAAGTVAARGRRGDGATLLVTGSLLACAVVLEGTRRLHAFPLPLGYGLLILQILAAGGIAVRQGLGVPLGLVLPASLLSAWFVTGGEPAFPWLAATVLAAAVVGQVADRRGEAGWVRAVALVASLGVWALWALEAVGGSPVPPAAYGGLLAAFVVLPWAAVAWRGALGVSAGPPDGLEPGATVVWAYAAARAAFPPGVVGSAEVLLGVGLLGTAALLARRPGRDGLAVAGVLALGMGVPGLVGRPWLSPVLLAAAAYGVARLSARWASGGVRAGAYLLCVLSLAQPLWGGAFGVGEGDLWVRGAAVGAAGALSLVLHRWCRKTPPPPSGLFRRVDRTDDSAVAVLLVGLSQVFVALRFAAYGVLQGLGPGVFGAAQSVILCGGALGLLWVGAQRSNGELRAVAALVYAVAAGKVFGYDLFWLRGVPLVASVLALGGAAAAGGLILARRSRPEGTPGQEGQRRVR